MLINNYFFVLNDEFNNFCLRAKLGPLASTGLNDRHDDAQSTGLNAHVTLA